MSYVLLNILLEIQNFDPQYVENASDHIKPYQIFLAIGPTIVGYYELIHQAIAAKPLEIECFCWSQLLKLEIGSPK